MRLAVFTFAMFLTAVANAQEWKTTDYAMLSASTALLVIDWGQTRSMTKDLQCSELVGNKNETYTCRYRERNPILGEFPSRNEVDRYFTMAIVGHAAIAYALRYDYRRYFLSAVIVLETVTVLRNHRLGIRVEF